MPSRSRIKAVKYEELQGTIEFLKTQQHGLMTTMERENNMTSLGRNSDQVPEGVVWAEKRTNVESELSEANAELRR